MLFDSVVAGIYAAYVIQNRREERQYRKKLEKQNFSRITKWDRESLFKNATQMSLHDFHIQYF